MAAAEVLHSPSSRATFEQTLAGDTKNNEDEDSDRKPGPFHPYQVVSPRTITGPANMLNKGAIDWGHHGLMAYGSNTTVFVVDTKNVQLVQTLERHKSVVKKILWVSGVETKKDGPPGIQLISGDASGQIIHWDITTAMVLTSLQDGNKPVLGMEWVPGLENELMLAALHSPYFLIIWDIKKQSKLWKKSFTDTLLSFNFDPFDGSKIAFLCHDCILFVDDFQIGKIPSTNGRKFYISSPRLDQTSEESLRGRDRLKKLMKGLVIAETKPKPDEVMTISECIQLAYHRSLRHHLILLYPRDIILIDLHIYQTIGIVPIERTMSPLIQSCTEDDLLRSKALCFSNKYIVRIDKVFSPRLIQFLPFSTNIM